MVGRLGITKVKFTDITKHTRSWRLTTMDKQAVKSVVILIETEEGTVHQVLAPRELKMFALSLLAPEGKGLQVDKAIEPMMFNNYEK